MLRGIRALAPRDRLLVALRAQGLSYQEIAGATGIRSASVGRLLARAIDRLAKELELPSGSVRPFDPSTGSGSVPSEVEGR